jgi:hypothetical protein
VAEYGVWLEEDEGLSGTATLLDVDEAPVDVSERQTTQFVWRGTAEDGEEALEAARSAWEARYGPPARPLECFVLEIEPSDSGYLG